MGTFDDYKDLIDDPRSSVVIRDIKGLGDLDPARILFQDADAEGLEILILDSEMSTKDIIEASVSTVVVFTGSLDVLLSTTEDRGLPRKVHLLQLDTIGCDQDVLSLQNLQTISNITNTILDTYGLKHDKYRDTVVSDFNRAIQRFSDWLLVAG